MPSKERPFIFKQIHDTPSGSEELPELLGEDRAALTIFIKRAWELPGEWHRFPGSDFVLRVLPSEDMSRTPRFEIRSAVMSVYTREFRCDLVRRIVDSMTNGAPAHLHEDLNPSKDCPFRGKPDQFARAVIATIVQRPDIVRSPHAISPHAISPKASDDRPSPVEPGAMGRMFSEMMRRLMDHWTGPAARDWGFWRRFCFASGGSLTFLLSWAVLMTINDGVEIMGKIWDDPLAGNWLLVIALVILIFTSVFGYFVSWKDRQYGPSWLYLSGFLLPYIVWFLLSEVAMPAVESNNE